jgi:hypothetical protein
MTTQEKQHRVKSLVKDMLKESYEAMIKKVDKALNSGAIDIDGWDEKINSMILPKCIVTAILQDESTQYEGKGTSFEKKVKKEVKNIRHFL